MGALNVHNGKCVGVMHMWGAGLWPVIIATSFLVLNSCNLAFRKGRVNKLSVNKLEILTVYDFTVQCIICDHQFLGTAM